MTIKFLDGLWRKLIRIKCNDRSFWSGAKSDPEAGIILEAHHVVPKAGRKNVRWDVENGIMLTVKEHAMVKNVEFNRALIDKFGREKYEALRRRSVQYFDKNYERIEKELKQEIGKYEERKT